MQHGHMNHDHSNHVQPLESGREYLKFAGVILGILVLSYLFSFVSGGSSMRFYMSAFMGAFFIVFGAFKLINIEMFALTYRGYDVIAKRFPAWGYIYPFVELFLGISYLLSDGPAWVNLLTLLVTGIGSIGVYNEIRPKGRRRRIMCACLGTVIRLPLSKVSLVEDVLMFFMAFVMFFI